MDFPNWQRENWIDAPNNPVVGYWGEGQPHAAIGDPQVLIPGEFDSKWHIFYHGFYDGSYVPYFHHIISDDGYSWELLDKLQWNVNPVNIFHDNGKWYVYYSAVISHGSQEHKKYGCINIIRMKCSEDLKNWSEATDILIPELDWEKECDPSQPGLIEVRNPCMVKIGDKYRLYYSAGTVKLHDCGYEEPKYIGFAESDSPTGPFVRNPVPIIKPDKNISYRNYGSGAIKVFGSGDEFIGLYNSIYVDCNGCSRSAINLIKSHDGISWQEAPFNPIIIPADEYDNEELKNKASWKRTLVYQLDIVRWHDELRIYYNAREGTSEGIEKIGCSVIKDLSTDLHKLWDIPPVFPV